MTQIARNVTDVDDGFLRGTRYLILDRDAKYTDEFRNVLDREGVRLIRLPPRSPNLNAFAERFVRSIKSECLSRMIFFGQASLRHALIQYLSRFAPDCDTCPRLRLRCRTRQGFPAIRSAERRVRLRIEPHTRNPR
jgi:Integrase core domain